MPGVIRRGAKAAPAARSTRSLWKTLRFSGTRGCVSFFSSRGTRPRSERSTFGSTEDRDGRSVSGAGQRGQGSNPNTSSGGLGGGARQTERDGRFSFIKFFSSKNHFCSTMPVSNWVGSVFLCTDGSFVFSLTSHNNLNVSYLCLIGSAPSFCGLVFWQVSRVLRPLSAWWWLNFYVKLKDWLLRHLEPFIIIEYRVWSL